MNDEITFLGIQMDCTPDPLHNAKTIANAIDENPQAEYAVTPECALTGYSNLWQMNAEEALDIVSQAARRNQTAVFLGAIWKFDQMHPENTCLILDKDGGIVDHYSKTLIIPLDQHLGIVPGNKLQTIPLPSHPDIRAGIMICNDFWGSPMINAPTMPTQHAQLGGANIFIHLTNGDRGIGKTHDKVYWDWHTAWLQMMSRYHMLPIISVDNSCGIDGQPYNGRTASPSGVWILGRSQVEVPDKGEYNFTYGINKSYLTFDPYSNPFVNANLEL